VSFTFQVIKLYCVKMNKMNKRASIPVTVVVVLTIAIVTFTLFTFITRNQSVVGKFVYTGSLEKIYAEESAVRLYLKQAVESSMIKTAGELKKEEYARFPEVFGNNLAADFNSRNSSEENLAALKTAVLNNNFKTEFNDNILSFKLENYGIKLENREISAFYTPEISFSLNLSEITG
jgi:hypothetical protein